MEYVLWGRKADQEAIDEQVITSTNDKAHLEKATQWAKANGFTILRVAQLDLRAKPDFVAAINL